MADDYADDQGRPGRGAVGGVGPRHLGGCVLELGPDWLVDASAVIANFEMMTRLADATGARLRPEQLDEAASVRAERDLDRFESRRG